MWCSARARCGSEQHAVIGESGAKRWLIGLALGLLAARLLSLGLYPLGDTTEARYGEVARLMLASGDWITPQNDPGVPFWAKPPLSFWAQAATMAVFGVNEFGARISSTFFALIVAALSWRLARSTAAETARYEPWFAVAILATMPLFFLMAGTVMTDMALAACTTAAMVAFWLALEGRRRWGYVFFAALGLGLLAKGPVVLALVGLPLALWWVASPDRVERLRTIAQRLPLVSGTALMLLIAAPWYVAAEIRTPGFLEYFLLGEHVQRFLRPDWQGDLYGLAHLQPKGMVWVFLLYAAATWLPWLLWHGASRLRERAAVPLFDRYLLAWTAGAPFFFTLASNTIWSYMLPALPALALLLARALSAMSARRRGGALLAAGAYAIVFAAFALWWLPRPDVVRERSTRVMLETIDRIREGRPARVRFVHHLPHSTKFYSRGTVQKVSFANTRAELDTPGELFLIVAPVDLPVTTTEWNGPAVVRDTERIGRFGPWVLLHRR